MAQSPEMRAHLAEIARRLDAAGHSEKGAIIQEATAFYGWSRDKLYRTLKTEVGWTSGRKTRADKGATCVPVESLEMLAAAQRESVRANGKQILFTPTGASMLEANAIRLPVSNAQLNRLMRARKLDVKHQEKSDAPVRMRSLHPNHVHQVDPSLCVLYYLPDGKQAMMEADQFYKNKFANYAKVKLKVWRYVLYDHTSGLLAVRYYEAAGESQTTLFEFLMWAWGKQEGREFHGLSKILVWDKGSANTAPAIKNLLTAVDVTPIEHAAGKARVKGGVECGNNIVECKFESRLKFEPVHSVDELNAAVLAWQNAFNVNLIPREDTRLHRRGMTPIARYDLWRRIKHAELRLLPNIDVCRALLEGKETLRTVHADRTITFRHPAADRTRTYKVAGLDGVCAGDKVAVRPLVFGDCAIHIRVERFDGADLFYRVEAEPLPDEFGMPVSAPVWGESHKSLPDSQADRAAKRLDQIAYPEGDASTQRRKQVAPFGGALNAHSHLKDIDLPVGLPRRGSEISVPDRTRVELPPLSVIEVCRRLVAELGRRDDINYYEFVSARYPQGVPVDEYDALVREIQAPPRKAALTAVK